MTGITLANQIYLAQQIMPLEWAKAGLIEDRRLRRRRKKALRQQAIYHFVTAPIRAAGGACSNCQHLLRDPAGLYCEVGSDFYGYQVTRPASICIDYQGPARL